MELRDLGTSGLQASAIGLGTWAIGGWMWGGTDEAASVDAIRVALDEGITLIDTAPVYGLGRSEELVGRAIAGRREEVVLASKCGLRWDAAGGEFAMESEGVRIHRWLSPASIRHEVEASLRRLNTDRIDLLQTHWQEGTTPIEDTMGELVSLQAEGKIRAIGVCNASVAQMERYRSVGRLDTDQERYSLLDRELEENTVPYVQAHAMAILAYSPLALGLLTGKVGPDRIFPDDDLRHDHPRFTPENRARVQALLADFTPMAASYGVTLAELVLAWTLRQPGIRHVLVGARTPAQSRENARAGQVALTEGDADAMRRAAERFAWATT